MIYTVEAFVIMAFGIPLWMTLTQSVEKRRRKKRQLQRIRQQLARLRKQTETPHH